MKTCRRACWTVALVSCLLSCEASKPKPLTDDELATRALANNSKGRQYLAKIKDPEALERVAVASKRGPIAVAAVKMVVGDDALFRIASTAASKSARQAASKRIERADLLVQLATDHSSLVAVSKITDRQALLRLALDHKNAQVRKRALACIPTKELAAFAHESA